MNRYLFIALDRKLQLRMIRIHGRIINRKIRREYTASIYQIENFYIEVWEKGLKGEVLNLVTYKDQTLLNR